jgi:hypothetical protein
MEDSSTGKPECKCSSRRNSQSNPFTISFSTILYSSHRLELLFSFLSSICEALDKLYGLETTYAHSLFAIANTIDGSLSLFLHHPGGYLFLSSFQDQSANGANDETEDDDATDGEGYEQGSAGMSARSGRSCISFYLSQVIATQNNIRVVSEADCKQRDIGPVYSIQIFPLLNMTEHQSAE